MTYHVSLMHKCPINQGPLPSTPTTMARRVDDKSVVEIISHREFRRNTRLKTTLKRVALGICLIALACFGGFKLFYGLDKRPAPAQFTQK